MRAGQLPRSAQAQPRCPRRARHPGPDKNVRINAPRAPSECLDQFSDVKHHRPILGLSHDFDPAATLIVLYRVRQKILRDHSDVGSVCLERKRLGHVRLNYEIEWLSQGERVVKHALQQLAQIKLIQRNLEAAGIGTSEKEQVVRDGIQLMDLMQQSFADAWVLRLHSESDIISSIPARSTAIGVLR